jgi:uncharacterized protein (PEP-CTERM system associated)
MTAAATAVQAEVTVTPWISVGGAYVDNIDLAPPGAPKNDDVVAEITPGLELAYLGRRFVGELRYSAQILYFDERSELNSTHHNGLGNATWTVAPDALFVDVWGSYTQQPIDPTQPRNVNNLYGVGNTTDEIRATVSPYYQREFTDTSALLRYSASSARFTDSTGLSEANLQDSLTQVVSAQYASKDSAAPFAWSLDGRSMHTHFDLAQRFRSDQVSAGANTRIVSSLRLVGAVGLETDILESSTTGGLNSVFWSAGLRWVPNPTDYFEARIGHRFFGSAWSLDWRREGRVLVLRATYTEEPTTDSETGSLIDFVPGSATINPTAYATVLRASTTYSPYLRKQFAAVVQLNGRLTHLTLRGYHMRRDYFDPQAASQSDTTRTVELILTRDLSAVTRVDVTGRHDVVDQLNGVEYRDRRYELALVHQLGATLSLRLQAVHLERSGDFDYRSNVAGVTLRKSF